MTLSGGRRRSRNPRGGAVEASVSARPAAAEAGGPRPRADAAVASRKSRREVMLNLCAPSGTRLSPVVPHIHCHLAGTLAPGAACDAETPSPATQIPNGVLGDLPSALSGLPNRGCSCADRGILWKPP